MACLSSQISTLCLEFYNKLPKSTKPKQNEWTVLSCIVQINDKHELKVVSLGTGSKCLGASKMDNQGLVLNDSHAEIMARRGFLRYLYEQLRIDESSSIFRKTGGTFELKADIKFHFYTSHTPCGDASIVNNLAKKRDIDDIKTQYSIKRRKNDSDVYTECNSEESFPAGHCRTKPGRGTPTLSLSCSDKIARWIRVGVQGALLSRLIEKPILFESIIVGNGCPFSHNAMHRALINRSHADNLEIESVPQKSMPYIKQVDEKFEYSQADNQNPSPNSVVWSCVKEKTLEIAVSGRRMGTTKKNFNNISCSLMISKRNLFKKFIEILTEIMPENSEAAASYAYHKNLAVDYQMKSVSVKEEFLKMKKPEQSISNFCL